MPIARKQLSVRAVSQTTFDRLKQVHEIMQFTSRTPMGALIDEAVSVWWARLGMTGAD